MMCHRQDQGHPAPINTLYKWFSVWLLSRSHYGYYIGVYAVIIKFLSRYYHVIITLLSVICVVELILHRQK